MHRPRPCELSARSRQFPQPLRADGASSEARCVSPYRGIGKAHLRGAVRAGHGLPATALPVPHRETAHPAARIRGAQHGQEHIPQLPQSPIRQQCNLQYKRGFPKSVQLGLGRETAHPRGRGASRPQGGQRAAQEPQHHPFLQGGGEGQGQRRDFVLHQVRSMLQQRASARHHRRRGDTLLGEEGGEDRKGRH